jgi:hypothetical protein
MVWPLAARASDGGTSATNANKEMMQTGSGI